MFWDGGITKMIQMSYFLNMKIYKRFVGVTSVFSPVLDSYFTQKKTYRAHFLLFLARGAREGGRGEGGDLHTKGMRCSSYPLEIQNSVLVPVRVLRPKRSIA